MIYRNYLKRIVDIVGAIFGIILFSPIMIGISVWIKLVSPEGTILADIPQRVGKNRKPFHFYKFRSMYPNAHNILVKDKVLYEKYVNCNFKINSEEDPRIIKGGVFIRKSSFDELPQFFNIIKGEMSLVGPRAYYFFEVDEQLKRYPEAALYFEKVMSVKPGLTGLWQVSGRSEIGFVDRVKLDAEYANKYSLLYDLMIILKTPYVVLTRKGAL